jgi:hypothetical protein
VTCGLISAHVTVRAFDSVMILCHGSWLSAVTDVTHFYESWISGGFVRPTGQQVFTGPSNPNLCADGHTSLYLHLLFFIIVFASLVCSHRGLNASRRHITVL